MSALGLSPEALALRRRYIQAGDAARIMAGEWRAVWRIKMGLEEEPDLSDVLAVQMGSYTEPFNLAWCERVTGRTVEYFSDNQLMQKIWYALIGHPANSSEHRVSKRYPFMACNLDGMSTTPQGHPCVLDAKHVGRSDEQMVMRYTPAGVLQATVMDTEWWGLSVFVGNARHEVIYQEVDPIYQATLIAKCREFWGFVERGEEPPEDAAPAALPPKPQPTLRKIEVPTERDEVFDALMRMNNWLPGALKDIRRFIDTDGAAKANAIAREQLKQQVPEDVGELIFGRYRFHRTKAGAVTQAVKPMEKDDENDRA